MRKSLHLSTPRAATARRRSAARRRWRANLSGKFFIYKYDPTKRYAGKPSPASGTEPKRLAQRATHQCSTLPPVNDRVKTDRAYLVAEMIFKQGRRDSRGWSG